MYIWPKAPGTWQMLRRALMNLDPASGSVARPPSGSATYLLVGAVVIFESICLALVGRAIVTASSLNDGLISVCTGK